ncbi:MAG: extracellular solute-binding protein, partial [Acutalibacteraceae bacterium]
MKKIFSIVLALCLVLCLFAGCGGSNNGEGGNAKTGSVYYLNFKPEQDKAWQDLAAAYKAETGVDVKVLTAADGTYDQTLTSEIEKTNAPTLFQVSGTVGLESWKEYCLDISDSKVYGELTSDDFALIEDGKVYGVAYVYEGFGIIVNTKLLEKAGYKTTDITDYA